MLKTICMALALSGLAHAPAAFAQDEERLLVDVPQGFKLGSEQKQDQITLLEYVPEAETVHNWSEVATVMTAKGLGHVNARDFGGLIAKGWSETCLNSQTQNMGDEAVNGYAASRWMLYCPLNPQTGRPESMMMVVIQGKDALYNIQYAFHTEMSAEQTAKASDFIGKVSVCDTRHTQHPCAEGNQ